MTDPGGAYCITCGRPLVPGAAFCVECGTPAVPAAAAASTAATPLAAMPASPAPAFVAAATVPAQPLGQTLQRGMAVASRGAMVGGMLLSTPWTAVVGGQADIGMLAKRWAPSLVGLLPRPSLRIPALSLLFSVTLDLFAAFVSGQPAALQMAGTRAGIGLLTAILGLLVGKRGGFFRHITTGLSAITSLVMLVSAVRLLIAAPSNPAGWLPLLPSLVCQLASVVAAVKTVVLALKRHP